MMAESFLNHRVILHRGDCLDVLKTLPDDSIDSCVTDPPYHLTNNTGSRSPNPGQYMPIGKPKEPRGGFMGKQWDGGDVAFRSETWAKVYRVLKPGAHLLAFGGTRTYHRMACAIEDAGFEIRDCIQWLYGSGFPKSHDVSKGIDRARDDYDDVCRVALWLRPHVERIGFDKVTRHFGFADETMARARWTSKSQPQVPRWEQWLELKALCQFTDEMDAEVWRLNGRKGKPGEAWARREVIGVESKGSSPLPNNHDGYWSDGQKDGEFSLTAPATDSARQWQGWGTALKPACEPIVLARKPLSEKTVAANVLRWGTGALNIDGCRVEFESAADKASWKYGAAGKENKSADSWKNTSAVIIQNDANGRWPANVIHDGSDEVVGAFPETQTNSTGNKSTGDYPNRGMFMPNGSGRQYEGDQGSAARFFYTAKADSDDRIGSRHPTTKPIDLMQYLVRLITPKGGTCLDPFAGTGTTGEAAFREGMHAVLIEAEVEYQVDIRRRMALCLSGPDERCRESIKAKLKDKPIDPGPLFGGYHD
jgi:DNA modification methylase